MATKFTECPKCGATPSMGVYFDVYECSECSTCYCFNCGDERCPSCASKEKEKIGEVWKT